LPVSPNAFLPLLIGWAMTTVALKKATDNPDGRLSYTRSAANRKNREV